VSEEESLKIPEWLQHPYWDGLRVAAVGQVICLILTSMVLDGGQMRQYFLVGAFAFWISIIELAARAKGRLTAFDAYYLRWGWLTVCFAAPVIMRVVWAWRGVPLP
jgi:hypothetical protein